MTDSNIKVEAAVAVLFAAALAVQLATGFAVIGRGWDSAVLLGLALLFGISAALQAAFGDEWRSLGL